MGMSAIRHLGRKLTLPQQEALLFALSEGSVMAGAWGGRGVYRSHIKTQQSTIRYLVGAGLLQLRMGTEFLPDDYVLTAWGRSVAADLKESK